MASRKPQKPAAVPAMTVQEHVAGRIAELEAEQKQLAEKYKINEALMAELKRMVF